MKKYNLSKIGDEIMKTAQGEAYYGNALRVAKDVPEITPEERVILDNALRRGVDTFELRMLLQDIAIKLWSIHKGTHG